MIGVIAILLMFGAIYSLLLRGRVHQWNPRMGNLRVRSVGGPNIAMILGVTGLAVLLLKAAQLPIVLQHPALASWLVGGVVVLLVGYILIGDGTKLLVGGLGVALLVLTEGLVGVIQIGLLAILLLWILGALRGWLG